MCLPLRKFLILWLAGGFGWKTVSESYTATGCVRFWNKNATIEIAQKSENGIQGDKNLSQGIKKWKEGNAGSDLHSLSRVFSLLWCEKRWFASLNLEDGLLLKEPD